jgi:hypothetical protein
MDRNTALILTIASVILCGCPGLLSCFMGLIFAVVSAIPGAEIDIAGSSEPASALAFGLGGICMGLILVIIPIAVWFFTMRRPATEM